MYVLKFNNEDILGCEFSNIINDEYGVENVVTEYILAGGWPDDITLYKLEATEIEIGIDVTVNAD
jgi:hypothetical protein